MLHLSFHLLHVLFLEPELVLNLHLLGLELGLEKNKPAF